MTSTGALIAALKAREVEKVRQGCPFNRTGKSLDELQLTNTSYNGQNWNSRAVSVIRGSTVFYCLVGCFESPSRSRSTVCVVLALSVAGASASVCVTVLMRQSWSIEGVWKRPFWYVTAGVDLAPGTKSHAIDSGWEITARIPHIRNHYRRGTNSALQFSDRCVHESRSVLPTKYHSGNQIKKPEVDRACSTCGGEKRCVQGLNGEAWRKETTWKTHT